MTGAPSRLQSLRQFGAPRLWREAFRMSGARVHRNSWLAGGQAGFVTALAMSLTLLSPYPHLVGYAGLGALATLFGRFVPEGQRALVVLHAAVWLVLGVGVLSFLTWLETPLLLRLLLLSLFCGLFYILCFVAHFGPPGPLIFVFALASGLAPVADLTALFERLSATALVGLCAWLVCLLTEPLRDAEAPALPMPPRAALGKAALRITLGAMAGSALALALDTAYPAWAAMGSMAVMLGTHLHMNLSRAVQRVLGTILGAILAWGVLVVAPPHGVLIALVVFCIVAIEYMIIANYGLGQVIVTPMALLMTYLAVPGALGADLAPERVIDTLIGAGAGLVMALLLSTQDERAALAAHHAQKTLPKA